MKELDAMSGKLQEENGRSMAEANDNKHSYIPNSQIPPGYHQLLRIPANTQ